MAKRKSNTRTVFIATLVVLFCVGLPWACEFEPSAIGRHPPVDDEDAGD